MITTGAGPPCGCDGTSRVRRHGGVRRHGRGAAPPLAYRVPRAQDRVAAPAGGPGRPGRRRAVPARAVRLRRARHGGARARAARLRRRRVAVPARRDHQPWRVHRAGAGGQPGGEQPPRRRPRDRCRRAGRAARRRRVRRRRRGRPAGRGALARAPRARRLLEPARGGDRRGRRGGGGLPAAWPVRRRATLRLVRGRPRAGGRGAARPVRGAGARRRDRPVGVRLGLRPRYGDRRAGVSTGPNLGRAVGPAGRRPGDEPGTVPTHGRQRAMRERTSAPVPCRSRDGRPRHRAADARRARWSATPGRRSQGNLWRCGRWPAPPACSSSRPG